MTRDDVSKNYATGSGRRVVCQKIRDFWYRVGDRLAMLQRVLAIRETLNVSAHSAGSLLPKSVL